MNVAVKVTDKSNSQGGLRIPYPGPLLGRLPRRAGLLHSRPWLSVSSSWPRFRWLLSAALGALRLCAACRCGGVLLSVLPLAVLLWQLSRQPSARQVVVQTFWAISAYFAAQLFWLVVFMHNLMASDGGLPSALAWPLAALALSLLFMLEGVFWAVMAALVARVFRTPQARLWGLAGGWVILEWTRTLGALAFPWSGLGYTLLRTPLIQVADLGGVLLLTALITRLGGGAGDAGAAQERRARRC